MAMADSINKVLGTESFADYEQSVYDSYQEKAELDIVNKLNALLSSVAFLQVLKNWGVNCACKYNGYKDISIRLKSGRKWKIHSPLFLKAKPKKKRGRSPKRQKGRVRHLGLELLGIIKKVSPALVEVCVSMAVLCPSFEVAANALKGLGVEMNQNLLQNITHRFAGLAMMNRVDCHADEVWEKPGIKILVCVDGGRIRERQTKKGQRKKDQKRQGFHSNWIEPRLLIITQFDENGKKIKSINPIIDGSCGNMNDFFDLLKQHLTQINLNEASEIIFCADNGPGIWPGTEKLIKDLKLDNAKCIIDYTHAKQNIDEITSTISQALKLTDKQTKKISKQIKELLWNGNICGIAELVRKKLSGKRKAPKAALKKLNNYFGVHSKFQYKAFLDNGLPTGSGSIESAIRRVINLRVKGAGMFWKRKNAENVIFLRSLVLTGKLRNACRKTCDIVKNMFNNNILKDLPMAA
jgi:hypothetical protein